MRASLPLPFERFSARTRRRALLGFAALSIAMMLVLSSLDASLHTPASPHGIVSFEFAREGERATRMLEAWGPKGRARAALSLELDFLFLAVYAPALALLCAGATDRERRIGSRLAGVGAVFTWAPFAAGGLDAIENLALLRVLASATPGAWPAFAAVCAGLKFTLVAAVFLYIISSITSRHFRRARAG